MPDRCPYRLPAAAPCGLPATHVCRGSGLTADWRADEVQLTAGERRQPEFCEPHAEAVACSRNQAHLAAREAAALRPRTKQAQTCAVCGERLQGVGIQIPEVPDGPVCDSCHRAANDAQLDDPRTGPQPKRRRRKVAAVIG
jgi:hypothetical protein